VDTLYVLDGSPDPLTGMGAFDGDNVRIFPHATSTVPSGPDVRISPHAVDQHSD